MDGTIFGRSRRSTLGAALRAAVIGVMLCAGVPAARADVTNGNIRGQVRDPKTAKPVAGVTVTAEGPQGEQAAITDDDGQYVLEAIPVGTYLMRFYLGNTIAERRNVIVSVDKVVRVDMRMSAEAVPQETVVIVERAPAVDIGSSRQGVTLDQDFMQNVPTQRDFGRVLEKAPGAFFDPVGLSLGGATGAENTYMVDGVNVTSIGFGQLGTNLTLSPMLGESSFNQVGPVGSNLVTDFVQEVEIIQGGYNAEYGRALGGVVNVITKSGSNDFHGSVFSTWSPYWMASDPTRINRFDTSLVGVMKPDFSTNLGAEVGGPIIKNKLFFWVGYSPTVAKSHMVRYTNRLVDANRDGLTDTDANGNPVVEEVGRSRFDSTSNLQSVNGKLTWVPAKDHRLSLATYGTFATLQGPRYANQDPEASIDRETANTADVSARWVSKFFQGAWQLEASAALHQQHFASTSPYADMRNLNAVEWAATPKLLDFSREGNIPGCADSVDPMVQNPAHINCPLAGYRSGGFGSLTDVYASRLAGQLKSSHFFSDLFQGHHQVKYGLDYELQRYEDDRAYSGPAGGRAYILDFGGGALGRTYFNLKPGERTYYRADGDAMNPDPDGNGRSSDLLQPGWYQDHLTPQTQTRNAALFLQDSYSLRPNLTLNLGLRWESQTLVDPTGATALSLDNNLAPRIGLVYDPTNQGRSKIYGHWGRFYESVPMDINTRAMSRTGELYTFYFDPTACGTSFENWGSGNPANGFRSCDRTKVPDFNAGKGGAYYPVLGENEIVQPGIQASYSDEIILGGQYQLFEDFVVGGAYINRELKQVIEDGSADGLNYFLANPGHIPDSTLKQARADAVAKQANYMSNPTAATQAAATDAQTLADGLDAIAKFPRPARHYNALQLTSMKRFSRSWMMHASYTYSRTIGNFPGLYAADQNQLDPNISSYYDIRQQLDNRYGPLPNDRPHLGRVDGYYTYSLGPGSALTTGLGFFARSGQPVNYQGTNPLYGRRETFILPRGSAGRTPTVTQFDLHLGYRRKLPSAMTLDAFIDVFNLFNQRAVMAEDSEYTLSAVNPIVDGSVKDLDHLKDVGGAAIEKSPNFRRPTAYQMPISGRLGVRVLF